MKKLWNFISNMGYSPDLIPEEARRIKLLCRLNFISFLVLFSYFVTEIVLGIYTFIPFLIIMELFVAIDLFLLYKQFYMLAKHFAIVIVSLCIDFFTLYTGDTFSEALFIALVAMPLIIFKNKKIALFYLFVMIASIIILKKLQPSVIPLLILTDEEIGFFRTLNIICAAVVTYFITYYFKAANEEYEAALVSMNELVSEKNKEITDSIEYAKHIQNGILPSAGIINVSLPQSFIFYKPKDIVAGDFYWIYTPSPVREGRGEVLFAACDCTGHGVPGAMVSVICSNALNRAVKEFNLLQPGEILTKVRELVVETFEKSENEVKDGMDISLCVWNKNTNELLWAGANNPLWIVSPSGGGKGEGKITETKPDKQPIGKTDFGKPFTTHKLQVSVGDTIYVFTDGYPDQFGGEKGKKFKYKQLEELLLANHNLSMKEQHEILSTNFDKWKGELQQVDDVLIMGIRV